MRSSTQIGEKDTQRVTWLFQPPNDHDARSDIPSFCVCLNQGDKPPRMVPATKPSNSLKANSLSCEMVATTKDIDGYNDEVMYTWKVWKTKN